MIRTDRRGRYVTAAATQRETASGAVDTFTTDVPVRRGDLPAIRLLPGAGIGVAPGVRGAMTRAFMGALYYAPPRRPQTTAGSALDGELALRVEYFPGGKPRPVPSLSGAAARAAPAGHRLAAGEVEFPGLRARTEAVVRLDGEVAIDLLQGSTRLQRMTVVGADSRGTLSAFVPQSRGVPGPYIIWRNPDGREILHHYRASASRLTAVD